MKKEENTIGQNIKRRREELGMTQEELAIKLGYKSKSTINKVEMGINDITQKKLKKYAEALNTTDSYIIFSEYNSTDLEPIKDSIIPMEKGVSIPVLGEVAAGIPIFADDNNIIGYEEIDKNMASQGEFFGLRIKGDSMAPRILDGDIVIVRHQNYAENNDIVIVLVNGDSATCKKINKHPNGITLISFNPVFEPVTYTNKEIQDKPVEIIGKVVENRQKY